jgi:hypothetical protein
MNKKINQHNKSVKDDILKEKKNKLTASLKISIFKLIEKQKAEEE